MFGNVISWLKVLWSVSNFLCEYWIGYCLNIKKEIEIFIFEGDLV